MEMNQNVHAFYHILFFLYIPIFFYFDCPSPFTLFLLNLIFGNAANADALKVPWHSLGVQ